MPAYILYKQVKRVGSNTHASDEWQQKISGNFVEFSGNNHLSRAQKADAEERKEHETHPKYNPHTQICRQKNKARVFHVKAENL